MLKDLKLYLMKKHGNKPFTIEYRKSLTRKDIPALPNTISKLIKKAIEERLAIDPIRGKPLQYHLKGYRRLRVSSYRIIYSIDMPAHKVVVIAIRHRKNIYDR